ncbi:MAG: MarR family winged helix-turn-helix transcriptional regulator [Gemmatimonadota bacterium]
MAEFAAPERDADPFLLFAVLNEIGIVHQLASTEFAHVLPHGLTTAQFAVLNHCVRTTDGKTPGDLARILQVTRGTMTGTLARLEAKGFVRITRDEADGRSKRVFLTAKGRATREASIAAAVPLLRTLGAEFPPEAAKRLLPEILALRAALDSRRGGGAPDPTVPFA